MNVELNVLNVKQGVIDDNGQAWANVTYLDGELKDSANAYGNDIAKMTCEPEFAKKVISDKKHGKTLFKAEMRTKAGKADLRIVGYGDK